MDRALGKNLEALAEEDDEEEETREDGDRVQRSDDDSDTDSDDDDDDDDFDPGAVRGEPNKFDGLCDGVLNAMALVHVSLLELLELKDELLSHSLPPTVLVNLALTTAKVFRSMSDMNMPVNELVRLVRVYSTPWEEKSAALKKLHEDYESKQRQLNIAIKRLQLVDAHSKRIAREKRIMNWEKLFSKVTTTKGHGRRWKFLIETIKQKAKMGLEHVQEYTRALEQASDSEDGEEEEVVDTTKATESSPEATDVVSEKTEMESEGDKDGDDEEGNDDEDESGSEEEKEVPTVTIAVAQESEGEDDLSSILSRSASPKKVRFGEEAPPPIIKPPMRDVGIDTSDPEYDNFLHVRIFCPEDVNHRGLKCSVTYADQMYKTGILDMPENEQPPSKSEAPKATPRPQAAGKGRASPVSKVSAPGEEEENKYGRYEEFMVRLPDEVPHGAVVLEKSATSAPNNVQIAVHHGPFEEIIAMTTLELADLKELDLRTVYLPPPKGDDDVPGRTQTGRDDDLLSLSDSVDLSLGDDESENGDQKPREDLVKGLDPLPFPLFSLHTGRSDAMSIGNLPLILYWGKKRRPPVFNRQTGTLGINEVVYDLTGIDLNTTTKEDLHKDMRDEALSAIEFTPEPQEETVPKTELDELEKKHGAQIEEMKDSYEKQLKALMENIAQLEEDRAQLLERQQNMRVVSAGSRSSTSPHTVSRTQSLRRTPANTPEKSVLVETERATPVAVPMSPTVKHRPLPPTTQKPKKNFRIGRPLPKWGEALPQDFLERLRLYEEESKQHMAELNERTLREIRDGLEKKLAGQHRLSKREEAMYDALKDVSLPALFMPFRSGTVFNPRAHQYFHPTGSTDLRLTQPPSMFQLPPLTKQNKLSVVNLFELSSNFSSRDHSWLMERYIQQQQPLNNDSNYNQSLGNSARPPKFLTQNSQMTDSGLDGPTSAQGNPSLPEQEVES